MPVFCFGADEALATEDLILSVTVPEIVPLGADISFAINLEVKAQQTVCSIGTADLLVIIQDVRNAKRKYVHKRGRWRAHVSTYAGNRLVRTVEVKKQYVEMQTGIKATTAISMPNEISTRLPQGAYSITVLYEGTLKAETRFGVVVDYEKTVPALIDLVAGKDQWSRNWARDRLFAIIGKPDWKPSSADAHEKVKLEVEKLQQWWKENRDIIQLVRKTTEEGRKILADSKRANSSRLTDEAVASKIKTQVIDKTLIALVDGIDVFLTFDIDTPSEKVLAFKTLLRETIPAQGAKIVPYLQDKIIRTENSRIATCSIGAWMSTANVTKAEKIGLEARIKKDMPSFRQSLKTKRGRIQVVRFLRKYLSERQTDRSQEPVDK